MITVPLPGALPVNGSRHSRGSPAYYPDIKHNLILPVFYFSAVFRHTP